MCIIWRKIPKSEFTMFQPTKRGDISSAKLLEGAKCNDNINVYSKPSKSKFKQLVLRKISNLNTKITTHQKLDLYWIFCGLFMKNARKMLLTGMVSWPMSYMESISQHN